MLSLLKSLTENKSVAILGFGREGRSTYKTLVKSGTNADITILDKFDFEDKKDFPVSIITGENYERKTIQKSRLRRNQKRRIRSLPHLLKRDIS